MTQSHTAATAQNPKHQNVLTRLHDLEGAIKNARQAIGSDPKNTKLHPRMAANDVAVPVQNVENILQQVIQLLGSTGLSSVVSAIPAVGPALSIIINLVGHLPPGTMSSVHDVVSAVLDQLENWVKDTITKVKSAHAQ